MKARIIDFTFGLNRKQRITVEIDEDFREKYDSLKNGDVRVDIKKYRAKRSLSANAYAWTLIDKIAAVLNVKKEDVYREAIKSIGGVSETICVKEESVNQLRYAWESHGIGWQTETMPSKLPGCVCVVLHYGSSVFDSGQMSALIENLVQDARALGIETANEEQLERYKDEWAR